MASARARRTATEVSVMRSMGSLPLDIGSRTIRTEFRCGRTIRRGTAACQDRDACVACSPNPMRRALAAVLLGLLCVLPVSAQPPAPQEPPPQPAPAEPPAAPEPPGQQPAAPETIVEQAPAQKPDDTSRLEPVVVTVTRTGQRAGDAAADVTVLTREDIS